MKTYTSGDIRNCAVVGHAGAGKTLLAEAMLACAGTIQRMGSIAAGTTTSDYHESERQHQQSAHATLLSFEWLGRKMNILDSPGASDFLCEALGALRVSDFALVVVHVGAGVQPGVDRVWEEATRLNLRKVVVVNQADRENTSFDRTLAELRDHFGRKLFPLSLPIDPGVGFHRVLDVLRSEVITYGTDGAGKYTEQVAEGEWAGRVKELHRQLIEYVAEADDALLEKFFTEGGLAEQEFRQGIHTALQQEAFVPVFVTSAAGNVGVARLLDFLAKYGTSPQDRATVPGVDALGSPVKVELHRPEPVAFVFKTLIEPHVGELSFFRVYSGEVRPGMELFNSDRKVIERLGPLYSLCGRNRSPVSSVPSGDLAAAVKLKDTHTGNTLCSPTWQVSLPRVVPPTPCIHGALRLKSKGDEEKVAAGLQTLHEEDPSFLHRYDPETKETVVSGQGEMHLQILCERLQRRFGVEIELVEPRVPYRETVRARAESRYRHKKQTGGAGQFAEVWLRIEPAPRDSGVLFRQSLSGQNVDRVFVPSVEKGVRRHCEEGVLSRHRVTDVSVEFFDGKMHEVDSNDVSFQIAGYFAFREAFLAAKPCLLEPIRELEIHVPEESVGAVLGDLSARRGRILGVDVDGRLQLIRAQVPQRELHRYATPLRALTSGRGVHTEKFSHYEQMPPELEAKVLAEFRKHQD